ncbi:hypothetical protein B0J13DRAFT_666278 [Dactylonectria estremocensis]|uniref:Apple domain-containing protein n=1 Tax=Dactylonectria estremocensis TaxID=1079267 RepID=A0A9P9EUW8_9HYPO|nr:hypothetical protein B0J13DRAFT_666278 [Dactylonectria estremocensis]
MRSVAVFAALALADFVAAGPCKPATTPRTPTTTPGSTTTPITRTVRNLLRNGNFEGYDPSYDGGIYAFEAENECRSIQGGCYQGDGSVEDRCVRMEARNAQVKARKRDVSEFAAIEQQLSDLDTTSLYTLRFYYKILQNDVADTCKFDVYYGNELFASSPYFPAVLSTDGTQEWQSVVEQAAIETASGLMRFDLNCVNGGYAEVYVDQVFVSNQVSPDNIDNISLIYTWAYSSTSTAQQSTTSASEATTTPDSTSDSTPLAVSSTPAATQSSTPTTQSEASSTSAAPTDTGTKYCATLSSTGDAGRGCGLRPYNPSTGYKTISNTRMTMQQCAAVCLADSNCQQFQWDAYSSSYPCLNICILMSSNLASNAANNGFSYYAYDRSCIRETECTAQPDGTTCVNGLGNTPGAGCRSQVWGSVKSCAASFLSTTVGMVCDSSKECRDVCAKYPDCKAYSINFSGGCTLYPGSISQIVNVGSAGSGQMFYDMSCSECGAGDLGYFNYVTQLTTDISTVNSCPAVSSTSTTSSTSTSTSSSVTSITTSLPETTPAPNTITVPSATTGSSSTVSYSCPAGISYPGACYGATPTVSGSICGERGDIPYTDPYSVSYEDIEQNSIDDCAIMCELLGSECSAYGWSDDPPAIARCRFSHDSLTDAHFTPDATWRTIWYDMGCVTCLTCEEVDGSSPSTGTTLSFDTTTRLYNTTTPSSATAAPSSATAAPSSATAIPSSSTAITTFATTTPSFNTTASIPSTSAASASSGSDGCPLGITYPGQCFSSNQIPPGSTCGEKGSVPYADPYSVSSSVWEQNTVEDCALYCHKTRTQCSAYGWSSDGPSTARCRFSHDSLVDAGFTAVASATITWYDIDCMTCFVCAPGQATATTGSAAPTSGSSTCGLNNGDGCDLKPLVAAQYKCNQAGTIQQEAYAYSNTDYPFQGSVEQCAAICAQHNGCRASAYDSSRTMTQCSFISSYLSSAGFAASASSRDVWSDQACWDCPSC